MTCVPTHVDLQQSAREEQTREYEETIKKKNKEIARTKDQRDAAQKEAAIHKASDTSKTKNWETTTMRSQSLEVRPLPSCHTLQQSEFLFLLLALFALSV